MSHLIQEYAKSLGTKIGKPKILEHYYPICHKKYITIHCDNKIDSKYYEYFPEVINLIKPFLQKNEYKIFQIGGNSDPLLKNVDQSFLNLSYKQSFFILKNSSLHVGIDSLPIHVASLFDIPIVALYSHIYPSNAYPFWSSKDKTILLEADRKNKKPSFSYKENPKTILTIKPEEIAKSILKLLNIKEEINFKTLKIGSLYNFKLVEVVPNFKGNLQDQRNNIIYIRADLHFDEENIAFWCANYKTRIVCDKIIPLNLLASFSQNIDHIFFKLNTENFSNDYFNKIKKLKIKFTLTTENKNQLANLRNDFFDFKVEYDDSKEKFEKIEKINSFFYSSKILISNGNLYPSEYHLKTNKTLDNGALKSYDDFAFWKDAEHYYFYE